MVSATATAGEVTIENIGAIEQLHIPIPPDGGVVVLRGRNGTGKTTALRATESLLTGKPAPGPTDGATRGVVEGFGVTLKVGKTSRRAGELTVTGLDGKFDVSRLVDPGIKDPVAADSHRIKALIGLTGVQADRQQFIELAGGEADLHRAVDVEDLQVDDLVDLVARVKRGFERVARQHEQAAEHATTQAETLSKLGVFDGEVRDADVIRGRYSEASALLGALMQQRRAAEAGKAERDRLVAELRQAQADDGVDCDSLATAWSELNERAIAAASRVKMLDDELQKAKADAKQLGAEAESARVKLAAAKRSEANVASLKESIASYDAMPNPTPAEITAASELVNAAEEELKLRGVFEQAMVHRESAARARNTAKEESKLAEKWRAKASACEEILTDAVARTGASLRVRIEDGQARLVTDTPRGVKPFSVLSEGERWRLAIDVAIGCLPSHAVLFVRQEAWEGLDPQNRAMVHRLARERGVTILTAEATGDQAVRADHFSAE